MEIAVPKKHLGDKIWYRILDPVKKLREIEKENEIKRKKK